MLCLGIESSCDDTAVALVGDGRVLGQKIASQASLHALFGGVVPELASRRHYGVLGNLFDQLMEECAIRPSELDAIAVARGPGLLGSLLVGVAFAKALAFALKKPLLGINHLHAHLLAIGLDRVAAYPAIGLLVSGGHTNIYRIEAPWEFTLLGRTLDDAAGEVFDKVGTSLGLDYPAGRAIDTLAGNGIANDALLPRPYLANDSLDFSFSGLKTAAIEHIRRHGLVHSHDRQSQQMRDFCATLNAAIADTLISKVRRALQANPDVDNLWLAGGVAANSAIRSAFAALAEKSGLNLSMPPLSLCGDNAAMIAHAGQLLAARGYYHPLDLETIPRGRPIPDDMLKKHV